MVLNTFLGERCFNGAENEGKLSCTPYHRKDKYCNSGLKYFHPWPPHNDVNKINPIDKLINSRIREWYRSGTYSLVFFYLPPCEVIHKNACKIALFCFWKVVFEISRRHPLKGYLLLFITWWLNSWVFILSMWESHENDLPISLTLTVKLTYIDVS